MLLGALKEKEVLTNWKRRYEEIRKDLPLSFDLDEKAAEIASKLYFPVLRRVLSLLEEAREKIAGKEVDVVGAYDTCEQYEPTGRPIIGAEGGAAALIRRGIFPEIIVTDLDGPLEVLAKSPSIFFVHFHGDNLKRIFCAPGEIFSFGIPTVQTFPRGPCINLGGFTDGDRAAFLAALFGATRIHLYAFNFEEVGKYSYSKDLKLKLCKLRWARTLIEDLERIFGEMVRWERGNIGSCLGR